MVTAIFTNKSKKYINKPIEIESVEYKDIYSQKTLIKILKGTHALIYVQHRLNHIYMIK